MFSPYGSQELCICMANEWMNEIIVEHISLKQCFLKYLGQPYHFLLGTRIKSNIFSGWESRSFPTALCFAFDYLSPQFAWGSSSLFSSFCINVTAKLCQLATPAGRRGVSGPLVFAMHQHPSVPSLPWLGQGWGPRLCASISLRASLLFADSFSHYSSMAPGEFSFLTTPSFSRTNSDFHRLL